MDLINNISSRVDALADAQNHFTDLINNVSSRVDALADAQNNGGGVEVGTTFSSVISGFNPFSNCTTRLEQVCNVTPGSPPLPCQTFDLEVNVVSFFLC